MLVTCRSNPGELQPKNPQIVRLFRR